MAAGVSYVQDAQALQDQLGEVEMNAAVAQQQYTWRALQARASVQAMAMEGNSVDRIVQDYSRQLGDQMTLEAINEDIRDRQYRGRAGQVQQYLVAGTASSSTRRHRCLTDRTVPAAAIADHATACPDWGTAQHCRLGARHRHRDCL